MYTQKKHTQAEALKWQDVHNHRNLFYLMDAPTPFHISFTTYVSLACVLRKNTHEIDQLCYDDNEAHIAWLNYLSCK